MNMYILMYYKEKKMIAEKWTGNWLGTVFLISHIAAENSASES